MNEEHFKLTKDQFREWDSFCTENGAEMYKNKDTYSIVHSATSDTYNLYIDSSEQSGIINCLHPRIRCGIMLALKDMTLILKAISLSH
jgi:hypothetical protein